MFHLNLSNRRDPCERNQQGLANELIEGAPSETPLSAAFADVRVWAGSSTITVAPRDGDAKLNSPAPLNIGTLRGCFGF